MATGRHLLDQTNIRLLAGRSTGPAHAGIGPQSPSSGYARRFIVLAKVAACAPWTSA